ncbi:UDP-N-acetyl-D-glucosamine 2-epimerase, UDP-hydrolysing [Microbacterium sediminis]|uniref:UDP-N-acetyl-D-glucosamine 2-epimerase, UDP-hydrolysing n=1 Tax=Microbacterium sediminis TaxID=904291 RepID=A0A1B9NDK3_9MICO|nr:UDP-N-acetyl-D-glucosamine 2-epimerase, UDP-hydrolysing [Microbacterium sediminis]
MLCGVAFTEAELSTNLNALGIDVRVVALADTVEQVDATVMVEQSAVLLQGMQRQIERLSLDRVVVLGDRWELLAVATAAYLAGLRIIHVHGGEVTEGALDERVRHAITKLADIHCVASEDAAQRVKQLGEPDDRVFLTGAPGLDRIVNAIPMNDRALENLLGHEVARPLALFTFHPPTADEFVDLAEAVRVSLSAAVASCPSVIVTDPGMDAGRDVILGVIDEMAARDGRITRISSLGARYPSVLAAVDVVVGNSSSGVIEAASAGVPAVDIGRRQAGRLRADTVVHASGDGPSVAAALAEALSDVVRARARARANPYGNGDAAAKIRDVILRARELPMSKKFIDR